MPKRRSVWGLVLGLLPAMAIAADPPPIKTTMAFRPVHADTEYDIPEPKAWDQCKVTAAREGKHSGWLVLGPQGQVIRRFMDTDGDGNVDQFSYYRAGVEVYRDIDSNGNNKVDQSRWLNTGGSRWGVDTNEDSKIDSWKRISAEEAGQLAVKALLTSDAALLGTLLVTADDLKSLGIKGELSSRIQKAVADPAAKLKKAAASRIITAKTTFLRFDSASPGVVPAEQWKTPADIAIYENAMAIIDPGDNKPALVQIGELVRVGEAWKLTGIPVPLDGPQVEISLGHLVTPEGDEAAPTAAEGLTEEERKLVERLQDIDKTPPTAEASRREQARYNVRRADILSSLRKLSRSDSLKDQWLRQEVDTVTAAAQLDPTADLVARLKDTETDVRKESPKAPVAAYVSYRRMLAEHALEMHKAETNEDRTKVNDKWLKLVEDFVEEFPTAEETADAALQLAIAAEFNGKTEGARKWYARITKDFTTGPAFEKATGALRRIDLTGKTLVLSGPGLNGGTVDVKQLRGKTVLVLFWTTWCKPCLEDLPELKKLYAEYRGKGFEVLGVNLDERKPMVESYLTQYAVTWPQIHSPGSLESEPAKMFGVISLPTMFLVDGAGKVVNRSISVADLKTYLSENLKK